MSVPRYTKIRLGDNKDEVFRYLKEHGFSAPKKYFPNPSYLIIGEKIFGFADSKEYFIDHCYKEVFFYDGAFHYENEQTKNNEGEERMTTEINYTNDWYIDCPKTKEEWEIFVKIMEHFGVAVYNKEYEPTWAYVCCCLTGHSPYLSRFNTVSNKRKVSLLEAITLLQRPVKTEQQLKIEELEATIAKAQEQIKELKSDTL